VLADGYVVAIMHPSAGADAAATARDRQSGSEITYAERLPKFSPDWMKAGVLVCR
jgi:hypothetical protein